MNDYKPNSNRFKEEQKQDKRVTKPVVTGKVVTKKKSGFSKFAGEFISEDAKNVKSYVIGDVVIPAIKKVLSDIVKDGIDMILYGERRSGNKRSPVDRISYSGYYDRDRGSSSSYRSYNSGFSYDDIVLDNRAEADKVLRSLDDIMATYKVVRVADLYDLVGISAPHTANGYGWTNIINAKVVRVRDGYMIEMPRAIPID